MDEGLTSGVALRRAGTLVQGANKSRKPASVRPSVAGIARPSLCRHCTPEPLDETLSIERANRVEQNQTALAFERDRHAKRRGPAPTRHRSDDDGAKVVGELWRRDDDAGSGFPNLAPDRGVESGKPNVAAFGWQRSYHRRLSSSSFSNSDHTRAPSPAAAMARLASTHGAGIV